MNLYNPSANKDFGAVILHTHTYGLMLSPLPEMEKLVLAT
jgi:hypothetical protein